MKKSWSFITQKYTFQVMVRSINITHISFFHVRSTVFNIFIDPEEVHYSQNHYFLRFSKMYHTYMCVCVFGFMCVNIAMLLKLFSYKTLGWCIFEGLLLNSWNSNNKFLTKHVHKSSFAIGQHGEYNKPFCVAQYAIICSLQ